MESLKTSILYWIENTTLPLDALQSDLGRNDPGTVQIMELDIGALRTALREIKRYAEALPEVK